MWWQAVVGIVILICAVEAIRAKRLLVSAMWLAGASASVALLLYIIGAPEIAVIELSVGAGLVTVLFVFAINMVGEEPVEITSLIPRPLAWLAVLLPAALLIWLNLPVLLANVPDVLESSFQSTVWESRRLDIWLQVVLIFTGVLGMLGLLAENKAHPAGEEKSA